MFLHKLRAAAVVALMLAGIGLGGLLQPGEVAGKAEPPPAGFVTPPDLSGTWRGEGWGTVVLSRAGADAYAGTYSDTFGRDVGRVTVTWSARSGRFEGTWAEGRHRFGRVSLRPPSGRTVRGAYSTDPACLISPGTPDLADLSWEKAEGKAGDAPPPPTAPPAKAAPLRLDGVRLEAVDAVRHTATVRPGAATIPDREKAAPSSGEFGRAAGQLVDADRPAAVLSWLPVARDAVIVFKYKLNLRGVISGTGYPMSLAELQREFTGRKGGMVASVELAAEGDRLVVTRIEGWPNE